jgi:NADPH:quinone reductase-like Zn-dependent oxidoreductase
MEQTAALGLVTGLHLKLLDSGAFEEREDEWLLILGGASAVGQSAIQVPFSYTRQQNSF